MSPTLPAASRRAFTLVELLVVIGIIALLISILLPTLNRARQSAQIVACLSNIRQLGTTTAMYVNENKVVLPEAMYNNKTGLSPRGRGAVAWTPLTAAPEPYVTPSIGELFTPYFGDATNDGVWQCPSAMSAYAGAVASSSVQPYEKEGTDPFAGTAAPNLWVPNYFYVNSKFFKGTAAPLTAGNLTAERATLQFPPTDWTIRNISGLPATRARSISGQGSSEIVVFVEYKSNYHTDSNLDVYQLAVGQSNEFAGNYAYLDGHGETQKYETLAGYMSQFSDPIPQTWYGVSFAAYFPDFFNPANFYNGDSTQPVP